MSKTDIKNFYEAAVAKKKFSKKFFNELKAISTEGELKSFIEKKVQPVAKEMGYNFSTEELLNYEKQMARKITEQQLEAISGGVNAKNLALGGIVSLMALGAGIIGTTSLTHAALDPKAVATSYETMEKEIAKEVEIPKALPEREKKETKGKSPEASQTPQKEVPSSEVQTEAGKTEERATTLGAAQAAAAAEEAEVENPPKGDVGNLETAKVAAPVEPVKETEKHQLTEEQKLYVYEALTLQEAYALLQSGVIGNLRICGNIIEIETVNGIRRYTADQGDAFTDLLYMLYPSNAGTLDVHGGGNRLNFSKFGGISPELMAKFCAFLNDYRNKKIANAEERLENIDRLVKNEKTKYVSVPPRKDYQIVQKNDANELLYKYEILNKKPGEQISKDLKNAQLRLYSSFMLAIKGAVDLEEAKGSPYPKHLTERILMSYMIKTLDTEGDVIKLYQEITKQLSQNETNKAPISDEQKAKTAESIEKAKTRIAELNEILKVAEVQPLSPYKSRTQSNKICYKIGTLDSDGTVQIDTEYFADCADIAARHLINLLVYSNEQNWDMVLPTDEEELQALNTKLKMVVDAINSKDPTKRIVKFYNLEERLQMFFLYQRGFIEGTDKEEDRQYRSKNGANDDTPLARTLWEYAICNMGKENFERGPDEGRGYYSIVYNRGNIELYPGYINQLKLMWNIARALRLSVEKLNLSKEKIDTLAEKTAYDETAFKEALSTTFSLFHPGEITCTLSNCGYKKIKENNEVIGKVTVDITQEDQKLNFEIDHSEGHAQVNHTPIKFDKYKYMEKYYATEEEKTNLAKLKEIAGKVWWILSEEEKTQLDKFYENFEKQLKSMKENDFARLLLRSFTKEDYETRRKISPVIGFYGAFSGENLYYTDDNTFKNTDLYKIHRALYAFKELQNEENNTFRIDNLIGIDTMEGAKNIQVTQITNGADGIKTKTEKTLDKVLYEKYLKPNVNRFIIEYLHATVYPYEIQEFGINEIYSSKEHTEKQEITNFEVMKLSKESNEVRLLIKNIPENGELNIPSTVYDENGKEYKVTSIHRAKVKLENLKKVEFTGNFEDLNIMRTFIKRDINLQEVVFTGKINNLTIGEDAFNYCTALTNFTIPNSITSLTIGEGAFFSCKSLTNFTIPNSVTSLTIGGGAFTECTALTNFTIPNSITSLTIGRGAFDRCKSLTNFTIPNSVTSLTIGYKAFIGSTALKSFTIPEGVTTLTLEEAAFAYCRVPKTITIPKSVKEMSLDKEMLKDSKIEKLYVPEHLKEQIPEDFEGKEKIVIYGATTTRSWWGNWLYLKIDAPIEQFTVNKARLEDYAKEAGFKDVGEIQAIQARNLEGKVIEIKLDDDLKGDFSGSQDVKGRAYGTWGKANLRKNKT